ncbi:MarR family winged helix-turn-helix transcriptional regulator [Antrihabitans stalactiti]|uniref:MarR family winged helix-turn-helix transcriptional regulator n=1 Tax=Antrihabitans stalactiti TaxID=2584121 RepID=UPI0030B84FDB
MDRRECPVDRRNVTLSLTEAGHDVVDTVTTHRRMAIAAVLKRIPAGDFLLGNTDHALVVLHRCRYRSLSHRTGDRGWRRWTVSPRQRANPPTPT